MVPGVPSDSLDLVPLSSEDDVVAGGNPDVSPEVFLLQTGVDTIRQLTSNPLGGFGVSRPTMSGDGHRLVFESDRDVVSGGNTDGSSEVFLRDLGPSTTRPLQVTDGPLGSGEVDISGDGRAIVFTSATTTPATTPTATVRSSSPPAPCRLHLRCAAAPR